MGPEIVIVIFVIVGILKCCIFCCIRKNEDDRRSRFRNETSVTCIIVSPSSSDSQSQPTNQRNGMASGNPNFVRSPSQEPPPPYESVVDMEAPQYADHGSHGRY